MRVNISCLLVRHVDYYVFILIDIVQNKNQETRNAWNMLQFSDRLDK